MRCGDTGKILGAYLHDALGLICLKDIEQHARYTGSKSVDKHEGDDGGSGGGNAFWIVSVI